MIPFFVFMLYWLIGFGLMLAQKQQITNATADAARSAIGATDPVQAARDRVHDSLGPEVAYSLGTTPALAPCAIGSGTCITVIVTYDYQNHPIIPTIALPFLKLDQFRPPPSFHSTAVVRIS